MTPGSTVVAQSLRGKGSTVLARSRTLCVGSAGAAAFAAASLTAATRGALPGGRSGRRDGRFRSNKGMAEGYSPTGGVPNLVGGVEQSLLFEQGAGHRQQAVGDGAQGAAMAVAAPAQRGITAAAERVVLGGEARPMLERVLEPLIAGITTDDDAGFAAAAGHRGHPGQGAQGVIISPAQRLPDLGEQHGEDDPS